MRISMAKKGLLFAVVFSIIGGLIGCAGLEYAPKRQYLYYHKELPAADRAVEAARAAGKDKECPEEFKIAEKMKNNAYETYWACRTQEGIAMANKAADQAKALCPKKAEAPAAPPPPPPPPVQAAPPPPPPPTASISANPPSVDSGKCTDLSWSTTNATSASIDQGIGSVDPSGIRQVCPSASTQYLITASGQGGTGTATTTVTVNPPSPPPPPPPPPAVKPVKEIISLEVQFDTDKADIKPKYDADIARVADYLKKYPETTVTIEGNTDNVGGKKYNQKLSERRAESVKKYLVEKLGADASKISSVGYGLTKPVADNKTAEGRQKNRRVDAVFR